MARARCKSPYAVADRGRSGFIRQLTSAPVARGGLSPSVLRRVREYIDANLEANIGLDAISKVAGLSGCHFVRAFRQSVGTTPHNFLMYRRFCKAIEFISSTTYHLPRSPSRPAFQIKAIFRGASATTSACRQARSGGHSGDQRKSRDAAS
jgi:AraC-like DNA-binding protein